MQRILAFLVLLMLPWAVRGQALADWYYWFDTDATPRESGKVTGSQFRLQTDVSHLQTGAHTLYVQVVDTAGVFSPPLGTFFFKVPDAGEFDKLFYTIDTEENTHAVEFGNGTFSLDVSACTVGIHSINLQVMDKQGSVCSIMPYLFYKVPADGRLSRFRYWFDNNLTMLEQPYGQGHYLLDVSGLMPGLHFINYFVADGANNMSDIQSAAFFRYPVESNQKLYYWFNTDTIATRMDNFWDGFLVDVSQQKEGFNTIYFQMEDNGATDIQAEHFIKIPQTIGAGDMAVVCVIDGMIAAEDKLPNIGGAIKWNMDVISMDVGLHKAMFQVITPSGAGSSIAETYFIRTLTNAEVATMQCSYTIDGFKHYVQKGTSVNGTFHFDLSVEDVENGLHRIDYMLVAENGATTTQGTAWFFKTPVGGNGITQYDYWLNDKSDDVRSVTLDVPTDPFQLIKLLPVTAEPIRSSCFHFETKSGTPMMYAKNEIHLRFYDNSGRWVDASDQYIDYNIGQEVIPVGELQETQTFTKVAENDVRWYTMPLEFGDSIAFKSNMACSMQVFSPNGEEVYSASGSQSTSYNGCHVFANGIYYMCIHDVTGTSQADIKLDYQKIDRYAILAYTPKSFGVPSTVNISLEGNGFLDGIKVYISKDETLIKANTLTIEDISHATANFIFDSIQLGKYDLRVVFAETDSITIDEAVSIEEGDSLPDVKIAIEGNPTFLSGGSATYNIRFTNRSNIPVFFMPFTLTIDCNGDISNLPYLKFETDIRQQIRQEMRMAFFDQCTPEELKALEDAVFGDDDLSAFYLDTVSIQGKTYLVGDFILPRLDGHSTLTIPFTIKGVRTNLIFYAFADSQWSITELVNIAKANGGGSGGGSGGSGGGSGGSGGGSGGSGGGSGGSGGGSGGSGGGSGGSGGGSGGSGGGSGGSGGGSGGSGSGSGGSGSGSGGSGSGSGGSGGCKDPCALKLAIDCFQSIVESVNVLGSLGEAARSCVGGAVKNSTINVFSKSLCNGEMPDLSNMQKNPKPIVMDITTEYLKCVGIETAKRWFGGRVVKTIQIGYYCLYKPLQAWGNPCPNPNGGGASFNPTPVNSLDPNEIYGYVAESGSKAIKEGQTDVFYTIQFENDTVFATAPAHDIYLTDTLEVNLFDLSTYRPTRITIGKKSMELTGDRNFISTMDMRPEINAIAQIEGTIDDNTGIIRWHISSLDPMTMEPSDDPMVGVLPVNFDGYGLGEASFDISLKPNLPDGTIIPNRSGNVFDNNEPILTPTWTNIVDGTAPRSRVTDVHVLNDSTATVIVEASDELSGPWRYNVYVQYETGAWFLAAENVAADTTATVKIYEGIEHHFYCVATDMAGNVEQKAPTCEVSMTMNTVFARGDVNGDHVVDALDASLILQYVAHKFGDENTDFIKAAADTNNDNVIDALDASLVLQHAAKKINLNEINNTTE